MPSNHLTACVDTWTIQAVMASRWLTRLYRVLADEHQAAVAAQAGAPAEKRLNRLGLQDQVVPLEEYFVREYPEETQAEEAAWTALVEALAGLSAFFASTNGTDGEPAPGLRGARTATYAALQKSIRGFHTAFPSEMVTQGVTSAIQKASRTCVGAFMADIEEEDPGQRNQLRAGLDKCVREALGKALLAEV